MANKFYAPGEQRQSKVRELFNAIAPRYDLINDLQSAGLHRYWKSQLLRAAPITHSTCAIDLCCGTGDLARGLAQRGARVVALDFSQAMLRIAQERLPSRDCQSLLLQANAQLIPCPDATFDIATIGYGLRNLAQLEEGLKEMLRVLKPGGRLLILDFAKPKNRLWRSIYFAYLRKVVPRFGRLFFGDPETHAYIVESLIHFPSQEQIAASIEELGGTNLKITNFMGGIMALISAEK